MKYEDNTIYISKKDDTYFPAAIFSSSNSRDDEWETVSPDNIEHSSCSSSSSINPRFTRNTNGRRKGY